MNHHAHASCGHAGHRVNFGAPRQSQDGSAGCAFLRDVRASSRSTPNSRSSWSHRQPGPTVLSGQPCFSLAALEDRRIRLQFVALDLRRQRGQQSRCCLSRTTHCNDPSQQLPTRWSNDVARKNCDLSVQKRGHWKALQSVRRCEKHGRFTRLYTAYRSEHKK